MELGLAVLDALRAFLLGLREGLGALGLREPIPPDLGIGLTRCLRGPERLLEDVDGIGVDIALLDEEALGQSRESLRELEARHDLFLLRVLGRIAFDLRVSGRGCPRVSSRG